MYYKPKPKERHPLLTFGLLLLLVVMLLLLAGLLSIYTGYIDMELPTLTQRFGPTPTPTRPAPLYVADGDQYFIDGQLQQAIQAYEKAIEIDPTNDVPYIRQSRLLIYTRNTAKALERASQAVLLEPTDPENLAYYCRALDWEAQYGAAYDACACAVELAPDYAEGYAFLAEVYADQGDWFSARTTAEAAIEANFQSMDAHHNMGYVLELQGRYAEAVEYYENAITLAPKLAPLYLAAGRSYYWLGQFETAADRFKQAIRLNPTDPEAYDRLGWTYHTNGEYTRAIDALEQSVGVDPTYERAWGHLGLVYYTRQNFEKAIEILPRAIELAENKFVSRARQVELRTEVESLTGPTFVPVLRGRFTRPATSSEPVYRAQLQPLFSQEEPATELELPTCAVEVVESIKSQTTSSPLLETAAVTKAFSQTVGTATLDLINGSMLLDIEQVPYPDSSPYEITVSFWPDREDSVGYVQPDGNQMIQANIQFEEKLSAPVEYYYSLGLAYAYLEPKMCQEAIPWLLVALEKDRSGYNPAWAGLRECPTTQSPPTPIPTATPIPTGEPGQ